MLYVFKCFVLYYDQRAALDRLQANLVYKNEKKIDDAVG